MQWQTVSRDVLHNFAVDTDLDPPDKSKPREAICLTYGVVKQEVFDHILDLAYIVGGEDANKYDAFRARVTRILKLFCTLRNILLQLNAARVDP